MADVYISSPYQDLIPFRRAVIDVLERAGHTVHAMEKYGAAGRPPIEECLRDVSRCSIYIGIVAWRYGSKPTEDNPNELSFTELEFNKAVEGGLVPLCYVLDRKTPWPPDDMDEDKTKVRRLISRFQELTWQPFAEKDDLAAQVAADVGRYLTPLPDGGTSVDGSCFDWPFLIDEGSDGVIDSLLYRARKDAFVGREREAAELRRFLASDQPFRWMLLTGRGGEGKSRLALEIASGVRDNWSVRLLAEELRRFDFRNWRPSRPTFLIIDYASDWHGELSSGLQTLSVVAQQYRYPVRLLLIAREPGYSSGPLFSPGRTSHLYVGAECPKGELRLRSIEKQHVVQIMLGRFTLRGRTPPDNEELLLEAAERLDPPTAAEDSLPRPLFAAAAAEALIAALGDKISLPASLWPGFVSALEKERVFSELIERDRTRVWGSPHASDKEREDRRLADHENVLMIATMTLGRLSRDALEEAASQIPAVYRELPEFGHSDYSFDINRFRRMATYDRGVLGSLQPDILGEYFVLERLKDQKDAHGARALISIIDTAWKAAPQDVASFVRRCYNDFPALLLEATLLLPSGGIADEWVVKLVRSLVDDLGEACPELRRPPAENETLSEPQRERESAARCRHAVEALRLTALIRETIDNTSNLTETMVEEAALAWQTAAHLVATVIMPDLISGDPRFLPSFAGSLDIEKPRRLSALRADFRSAQAEAGEAASVTGDVAEASSPKMPNVTTRVNPSARPSQEVPGAAAIEIEPVTSYFAWLESLLRRHTGLQEADRAYRVASRNVYYICYERGEGATRDCVVEAALSRLAAEPSSATLLEADLRILHAVSYCEATSASRASAANDAEGRRLPLNHLKRLAETVFGLEPQAPATPLSRRAVADLLRNVGIATQREDAEYLAKIADTLLRYLEAFPNDLELGYALSTIVAEIAQAAYDKMNSYIQGGRVGSISQSADHLPRYRASLGFISYISSKEINPHDVPRLDEFLFCTIKAGLIHAFLAGGETGSTCIDECCSLAQLDLTSHLVPLQIAALGYASLPIAVRPNGIDHKLIEKWLDWLLGAGRRESATEGVAGSLPYLALAYYEDDLYRDMVLGQIRSAFDEVLDGTDRPLSLLVGQSLFEVVGDAVLSLCSIAYGRNDREEFERWAALIEQPERRMRSVFRPHLLRIAALRLPLFDASGDADIESVLSGLQLGTRLDDDTERSATMELLLSAVCAAEARLDSGLAARVIDDILRLRELA